MVKQQDLRGERWLLTNTTTNEEIGSTQLPSSVLQTLLSLGKIEDPFYRCNEYAARELLADDFSYSCSFCVASEDLEAKEIDLYADGIDTLADIYINDRTATSCTDFHRIWRIPVKELLQAGENSIRVDFHSALSAARQEDAEDDIHYASTGSIHGNLAIRKPHYMFGWDWGPQLPDIGICRNFRLEYNDDVRLDNVHITQRHEDGKVFLTIHSELTGENRNYALQITLTDPDGTQASITSDWREAVTIEVEKPQLWWPNGLGSQPLYTVEIALLDGRKQEILDESTQTGEIVQPADALKESLQPGQHILDTVTKRIGLRTIEVCRDTHSWGEEFCFVVNGRKIFAMGANYVPEDNLLPRLSEERTRQRIADAKAANYNCLRVWGGGIYPEDYFYDACDEAGILIWQDLMFACNVYRLTTQWEQDIIAETRDQVRRIRDHACLALWCGNNEMEWGWGDMWERLKGHHPRYKAEYIKIFEYILPRVVTAEDPDTFFWESSPSSGGALDAPNDPDRGDQHYWEVWHSGKPFTEYRKFHFTFCSEYGFQSFPGRKTIESFTEPEDRNIFSRVMESHQKNGAANGKILNYVADYFLYPKDLYSLAYISQVLQLKAIQYGVEHWRRNRGRCMGSLYWQFNDSWPVASWASIDYYGRWKALHYGARRFYAPVTLSLCEEEELAPRIGTWVHNDSLEAFEGSVEVSLIRNDLTVVWSQKADCHLEPLSAAEILFTDFAEMAAGEELSIEDRSGQSDGLDAGIEGTVSVSGESGEFDREQTFARGRLYDADGNLIAERTALFVKPKHYRYMQEPLQITAEDTEEGVLLHVTANTLQQYVELDLQDADVIFTDNYFDITDPEGVTVGILHSEQQLRAAEVLQQITARSVAYSYQL